MEKKYKIRFMPEAQKDMLDIFEYISVMLANTQAAHGLLSRIDETISILVDFPCSYEKVKDATLNKKGYRVIPIDNYLIFYIVSGDTVKIRRVLCNKRLFSRIVK